MIRNGEVFDRDGNLIDAEVIPDGGRVVARMTMMDAGPIDPAEITRRAMADAQPLHRPGFLPTALTDAELDARETARDQRKAALSDAWRNPPALLDAVAAAKQALDITTDREARYEARDKRLENAWRVGA